MARAAVVTIAGWAKTVAVAGTVAAAVASGCAAPSRAETAPGPKAPLEVKVVDMSAEVAEAIADLVAERMARRSILPAGRAPTVVPGVVARPPQAFVPVGPARSTAAPPVPAPPLPPVTEAEVAALRESAAAALAWIASHQSENGSWSASKFGGQVPYDIGVTGLALVALVRGGNAAGAGPHAESVTKAVRYLRGLQDPEGCVGPRTSQHFIYNHGYAALALIETYGASRDTELRVAAQRAVDFVLLARNPYLGWRYGVRDGDNDTSVTGLMIAVLRAARDAGLDVDEAAFAGARAWIDKMTEPEFGRTGYQQRGGPPARTTEAQARFPASRSEALTAVGVATRVLAGEPADSEWVRKGTVLLLATPPSWNTDDGSIDLYYWYWGATALSRAGGPAWEQWRSHLVRTLPPHQRRGPGSDEDGSWDAADPWGAEGGRVYATAMACLAVQLAAGR